MASGGRPGDPPDAEAETVEAEIVDEGAAPGPGRPDRGRAAQPWGAGARVPIRVGRLAWIGLGLAICVAVVGGLVWKWDAVLGPGDAETTRRIAALERGFQDLRQGSLAALRTGAENAAAQAAGLASRLDAVESRLANAGEAPALTGLPARLDELESRVAALGARLAGSDLRPAPADEALAARIAGLESRLAAAEAAARRAQERHADIARRLAQAPRPRGAALLLAVGQLREVVAAGRPYAAELDAVLAVANGDPAVERAAAALAPRAAAGIPSRARLAAGFDAVAAEAARAAMAPGDGSWVDRAIARLSRVVTLRRVGERAGATPGDILARAEARLERGDLEGATAALADLAGAPAGRVADWRRDAGRRLAAGRAVAALTRRALDRLAADDRPAVAAE